MKRISTFFWQKCSLSHKHFFSYYHNHFWLIINLCPEYQVPFIFTSNRVKKMMVIIIMMVMTNSRFYQFLNGLLLWFLILHDVKIYFSRDYFTIFWSWSNVLLNDKKRKNERANVLERWYFCNCKWKRIWKMHNWAFFVIVFSLLDVW